MTALARQLGGINFSVPARKAAVMPTLLGTYLSLGLVLLLVGFFATGPCPNKNKDVVSDVVFVMGWPVYLYDDVVHGSATAPQWLHRQACEGGVAHPTL
jgi:hypothetical protein